MNAFASFHASGFWLVIALLGGVVALGVRPFLPQSARMLILPVYWVLLPYFALISGGVSPRLMGLIYIDWAVSLRVGIGLALALIALALGMRAISTPPAAGTRKSIDPHSRHHFWRTILIVISLCGAEEFFWAFLRGASVELLAVLQFPLDALTYWAIWIAAGLAAPTALVNTSGAYSRLIKVTILVMSSITFFYTRNFWLCWLLHAAVWGLFLQPSQPRQVPGKLAPSLDNLASTTERGRLQ